MKKFCFAVLMAIVGVVVMMFALRGIVNIVKEQVTAAQIPPAINFKDASREIADGYFEAGAKLGFSVAQRGGTTNDVEILIQAQRSNRVDIVNEWFEKRRVQ